MDQRMGEYNNNKNDIASFINIWSHSNVSHFTKFSFILECELKKQKYLGMQVIQKIVGSRLTERLIET